MTEFSMCHLIFASALGSVPMTNLHEIACTHDKQDFVGREFDITAPVMVPRSEFTEMMSVGDSNGVVGVSGSVTDPKKVRLVAGDLVRIAGTIHGWERNNVYLKAERLEVLGHGEAPVPETPAAAEIIAGNYDGRPVELRGFVRDVFADDIDSLCTFIVLDCGGSVLYAVVRNDGKKRDFLMSLVSAVVSVGGVPIIRQPANRRYSGRFLKIFGLPFVRVERPASGAFDVPLLEEIPEYGPEDIARLGRHRVSGLVLSALGSEAVLLRTATGNIVRAELDGDRMPHPGDMIEVAGFPESNLYHLNLTRCTWRASAEPPFDAGPVVAVRASDIMCKQGERGGVKSEFHGRLIRISGKVLSLSATGTGDGFMRIDDGDYIFPVLQDGIDGFDRRLEVGCRVTVTGICFLEIEHWRRNAAFPRIRGFSVAIRRSDDVVVDEPLAWWTPRRLVLLVLLLSLVLGVSCVMNVVLRRLIDRRTRELLKERTKTLCESLRVEERTRLAVELHDLVAQNLTGVAMQLETAVYLAARFPVEFVRLLELSLKTLQNCREELRNCLWDLRSRALDEKRMDVAIRMTLSPVIGEADLSIRFDVPRTRVSDASANATLGIVRELVSNAVRHGRARHVRIAGAIENGRLLFSVSDDGCGFDVAAAPGTDEGHFGLVGIRERVRKLGGEISIKSSPGAGTRANIRI